MDKTLPPERPASVCHEISGLPRRIAQRWVGTLQSCSGAHSVTTHILFVDDEEPNLVVFEAVCGEEFPVLTASSGEAGLELMRRHEVGVVLTDQRMPGMTGVELLEKVQAEWPDSIRLLITAYSDLQAAEDAINRGHVRRYLRKPWEPEALKAELRDAFDLYMLNSKVKMLEHRLVETERAYSLGVAAASLAEDLRTPIGWIRNNLSVTETSITTAISSLNEEKPNLTRARGLLAQVEAAVSDARLGVKRILELVDEMAKLPEASDEEIIDLGEVIRVTLRMAERSGLRGRALIEVASGLAPKVKASKTKLTQITLSLLTHAIHSVADLEREKGIVRISASNRDGIAVLDVTDNGPALTEEDLEGIFKPFGMTGRSKGAGVGLAISKRIASELGGDIEATRHPEGGTRFRLTLPLVK